MYLHENNVALINNNLPAVKIATPPPEDLLAPSLSPPIYAEEAKDLSSPPQVDESSGSELFVKLEDAELDIEPLLVGSQDSASQGKEQQVHITENDGYEQFWLDALLE